MKVYVFGNEDLDCDNLAIRLAGELGGKFKDISFAFVKPNEDVPFTNGEDVYILDMVKGINKIQLLTEEDLDKLIISPRTSVHDFDLGFQLRYLKKLGKLGRVTIIGVPLSN